MRREIGERDGTDAFGYNSAWRGIALEWIVEPHGLVCNKLCEHVCREDLGQGTKPYYRILGWKLMGVGCSFAISAEDDLIVVNHDKNHAGRAGLKEEVSAQSISGRRGIRLRQSRQAGQYERENKQGKTEFKAAHCCLQSSGYKW